MHVSERLLQLYADVDASTRTKLQTLIKQNLGDGKSLTVSFEELTGATKASLPTDEKSAADFTAWIKDGKKDATFLPYYVSLLEKHDRVLNKEATVPQPITVDKTVVNETTEDAASERTPQPAAPAQKPRYVPETPVPSRAERAKRIEPARPRKKKGKWLGGLLLVAILLGGGYIGYPYVAALFEPSETTEVEAPAPEPEPVVEQPETNYVWLATKNVNLVSEPNGTTVTYIGDIGDRYEIVNEQDDHVEVDLDGTTAWVALDAVTTDWPSRDLTDSTLLDWAETNLDNAWLGEALPDFFAMNEAALTETLGAPYGRETDALNAYAFYNGGFFVIQDDQVHAIDWTNTQLAREAFDPLGEPVIETSDALVYESETYSLRLFIGTNGQTRVRLTEK
ncbi:MULTISPECIES: hypothetical protein [unclassified Exiguobacterium]|uniref:hypothetical protein n=1 Tax=unclassified Exiguobacterium TaxID=2644629 RepID=UPI001040838D|nr:MULTISPECIES: hypothetical protein [unclassified Exiguobacterium]TCI48280.1 hypothetical protein EVJ31_04385 [Exiguobacterium sp. SH5S32]TCI55166.1 hypothetical protein EVJ25_04375 [Exiguobacterium sp. SH1S4]TCI74960.1 hypothetical protein EVJ23_04375 [Exiguobacterium sp. SH1S1]